MCNDYKLNLFIDSSFLTELVGNGIITEEWLSKKAEIMKKKKEQKQQKLS